MGRSSEYFGMFLAGALVMAEQVEREPPAVPDGSGDFWGALEVIEVRQRLREWPERSRRRMQFRAWRWSRLLWAMGDYCGHTGTDNITSVGTQRHTDGTFIGTVESTYIPDNST